MKIHVHTITSNTNYLVSLKKNKNLLVTVSHLNQFPAHNIYFDCKKHLMSACYS